MRWTWCLFTLQVIAISAAPIPKWDYIEEGRGESKGVGPSRWGEIDPKWSLCSDGKAQSPIDISSTCTESYPLENLLFNYLPLYGSSNSKAQSFKADIITNDGHTLKIKYEAGSFLALAGDTFEVKEIHFHSPSEHKIEGHTYPLEMQVIHRSSNGGFAVLAVLFQEGLPNKFLDSVHWLTLPHAHGNAPIEPHLNLALALGFNTHYWSYGGSLTTPPCTEDVAWFVLQEVQDASAWQIERIRGVLVRPNNRPVQDTNGRKVASSRGAKDGFPSTTYKMTGKVPHTDVERPEDSPLPHHDRKLNKAGVPTSRRGDNSEAKKPAAKPKAEPAPAPAPEPKPKVCDCLDKPYDCPCAPAVLREWTVPEEVPTLWSRQKASKSAPAPTKHMSKDDVKHLRKRALSQKKGFA